MPHIITKIDDWLCCRSTGAASLPAMRLPQTNSWLTCARFSYVRLLRQFDLMRSFPFSIPAICSIVERTFYCLLRTLSWPNVSARPFAVSSHRSLRCSRNTTYHSCNACTRYSSAPPGKTQPRPAMMSANSRSAVARSPAVAARSKSSIAATR